MTPDPTDAQGELAEGDFPQFRPLLPEPEAMAEQLQVMGIDGEQAARVMATLAMWRADASARAAMA